MKRRLLAGSVFSLVLLCGAVLSACGGGGGGGSLSAPGNVVPPSSPTPCPAGYAGTPPNCQQDSSLPGQFTPIAVPSATGLPAVVGYTGTILIPAANPAAQVNVTTSTNNPSGVGIASRTRMAAAQFARIAQSGTITPLVYISLTTSGDVVFTASSSMPGFPGFTFSLPASAGSGPFYLAYLEGESVWTTVAGPASPSACTAPLTGNCVTLQPSLPSLTITPQNPVYLLLYTGGVVPSVAPTSSPGGQPTSTASAGASPSAPPSSSSSSSPISSPSGGPTVVPTATTSATASPSSFPSTSPTASPTVAPNGTPPAKFDMGTLPSGTAGTALGPQVITGFEVLDSSGTAIAGSFKYAVTVTSNNSAVTLSVLGGATPGPSVSLTSGSQASLLALSYTGAAIDPVTITASATGATSNTATFAPPIPSIVYSGPTGAQEIDLYAPLGAGTGSTYQFTVSQAGYTGSFGNAILASVPNACSAFARVTSSNGSTGTTFTVSSIAAPTAGSCTLTLSGFGTTTTTVLVTYSSFGVTLQ